MIPNDYENNDRGNDKNPRISDVSKKVEICFLFFTSYVGNLTVKCQT